MFQPSLATVAPVPTIDPASFSHVAQLCQATAEEAVTRVAEELAQAWAPLHRENAWVVDRIRKASFDHRN